MRVRLVDGRSIVDGQPTALIGHRVDEGRDPPGGGWAAWDWDGVELNVINDAGGIQPAFYARLGTGIAVSPSIDRLLALGASRELDLDGLAAFLAIGYYLGDDTPFRAIRALSPAATLRWRAGVVDLASRPPPLPPIAEMRRAQAVDGVIDLMRTAIGRRRPAEGERFEMPLSGGRDSRHMLLELRRQGHPPTRAITTSVHGNDWGDDPPVARLLCARLGIDHLTVAPGPLVADEWRKNRLTGYLADEHAWYLPVAEALRRSGTARTYDGLGGVAFSRSYLKRRAVRTLIEAGRWDALAAQLGKKDADGQPRFASLLAPAYRAVLTGERATARIRAALDAHLGDPDPMLSFVLRQRTIREINLVPGLLLGDIDAVEMPFMDRDLQVFAASLPPEHVGPGYQDEVISRAYRDVADVPFAVNARPRSDGAFLRRVDHDVLRLLLRYSDGTIVDRASLRRRALRGSLRGDAWFGWGRRVNLITMLVQLDLLVAGRDPGWLH